jgi:phosphoglycolate phosphatase
MRYDLVILDLDGTLADSFPFFASVHNQLAQRYGFRSIDAADVEMLRGRSARDVMRHVGLPRWKLPAVARRFVHLMRAAEVPLFDGIAEALHQLHRRGVALALVSSNAADNCRRILGEENWQRLVHVECGASIFGKRRRIERVLKATRTPRERALYVGDQITDAEAAHAAGVAFCAVAWGYATAASLRAAKPRHLLEETRELAAVCDTD